MLIDILMMLITFSWHLPPLGRSSSHRWPAVRSSRQVSFVCLCSVSVWTGLSIKHQLVWQHSSSDAFIALLNC